MSIASRERQRVREENGVGRPTMHAARPEIKPVRSSTIRLAGKYNLTGRGSEKTLTNIFSSLREAKRTAYAIFGHKTGKAVLCP